VEEDVFSYVNLTNAVFLENIYETYLKNREAVDPSWRGFFAGMAFGEKASYEGTEAKVIRLIEAYRREGHKKVGFNPSDIKSSKYPSFDLAGFGLGEEELSSEVPTFGLLTDKRCKLKTLIEFLEETYCAGIGIETEGIPEEVQIWIQSELGTKQECSSGELTEIFEDIFGAELFESFLQTKYPGQTRFSLEGAETFIPFLRFLLEFEAEDDVEEVILCMAHRGRLTVLSTLLGKPESEVFADFEDSDLLQDSGDVKYHRGGEGILKTSSGKSLKITVPPNPSHLESVDPVAEGRVRALQEAKGSPSKALAVLVHGDASLAGQGIVYETLQMSRLEGYKTGGSLHVVINNQIGYTTLPKDGRSTLYCTDVAKTFGCPVFHVSAQKPVDCIRAARLAAQIRKKFGVDVFIDLYCHRKYGHNEGDEPTFTQPLEYQRIKKTPSIREVFQAELIASGVLTESIVSDIKTRIDAKLHNALIEVKEKTKGKKEVLRKIREEETPPVSIQTLGEINKKTGFVPEGFSVHPKVKKLVEARVREGEYPDKKSVDFASAELLAFGSLLEEGLTVRMSGQDVRRGTFSQRHAVWIDQKNGNEYTPLKQLNKGSFFIYDSPLSEFGVMGFELGYSFSSENSLVIWEAQYGDFYNGAQVIVDQYLSCFEKKWGLGSNLTLLLPHGYEGKGPEHSSARIERFLQLSAEDNWTLANCTTPSQFFHLIRRQAHLKHKTPLIVFTPKGLLRHPSCVSSLKELSTGAFEACLEEPSPNKAASRLVLCSGKVFYDLLEERKKASNSSVSVLRIEQLYPFPKEKLQALIKKYPDAKEFMWVQEEPKNMGAWGYLEALFRLHYPELPPLTYVGREESSSVATGSYAVHKKEYEQFIKLAFI